MLDAAASPAVLAAADLRAGKQAHAKEADNGREAAEAGARGVREAEAEAQQPGRRLRVYARQEHRRRRPQHRRGAQRTQRGDERAAGAAAPVEAGRNAAGLQHRQQQRHRLSREHLVQPKRLWQINEM